MKKLFKWIFIILGIFLILLIAAPFIFKDKIVAKIKTEANNNLNAKLDFGDFDLSLIRNFPNLSVRINNLSILNLAPFEGDTLIYAGSLGLTIDIMSVLRGSDLSIKRVSLEDPIMNFLVDKAGRANWDIAKSSAETADAGQPSSFKASLQKYTISNGRIVYDDRTMPFVLRLAGVDHTGSGDFTQDLFLLKTKSEVKKADMAYGGVYYVSKAKADIDADLDMDMKNMRFSFKENKILLNELELGLNGWIAMPDTNIDMDLTFNAVKTEFSNFISIVPAVYSSDFKDLKSSGTMALEGFIKGRFNGKSMPGFGITLNIDNGMFQYPALPSAVKNVFVDLKVNNSDGDPDHTQINLSKFHVEINNDAFDARLMLKDPVSDPDIDAFMKGKIDLSGIQKLVPLEKGTTLSGMVNADVTAKGRMSSIEQKRFDQFTASGNFGITGMKYSAEGMNAPVMLNNVQLSFSPQRVALTAFNANIGKSDFNATGTLDNFLAYAIKDETLRGSLSLNSQTIDLNEFMGEETTKGETTSSDTVKMSVLEIPGNVDFAMTAGIQKLIYQNLIISDIQGKLVIRDNAIRMQDVLMKLLDGSMSLSGGYSSADIRNPNFDFSINAADFDIQKTVTTFVTVEKLAPIAKNCSGKFSTEMSIKGNLSQAMEPEMNSLNGGGKLVTSTVIVSNFPVFSKIAETLKMDSWKSLTIPPVKPSFKFVDGRVFVDPFEMSANGIAATVTGSNGFDQTIDYVMATKIPRSAIGGAANSVINGLVSSANAKGANVSVGDIIPVNLKITGTVNSPKVEPTFGSSGGNVMEDLKAKAKEEFEKQKAEAEARAREEADKLKKEAEAKLDAEKQKAEAEAEKLRKEAEAKAKAQADSLKKAAEKEAQDKLKNLNPFKK